MKPGTIDELWRPLKIGLIIGDDDGEEVGFANGSLKGVRFSQLTEGMSVVYGDVGGSGQLYANTVSLPAEADGINTARARGWKEGCVVVTTSQGGVIIGPGNIQVWYGNDIALPEAVAAGLAGQEVWYTDKLGVAPGSREATWVEPQ